MNIQTNALLSALLQTLEAKQSKMMKCSQCGCEVAAEEAMKAGDGEMLCEGCYAEMKKESVDSDDDTFLFYEWAGGNEFVEKKEKGPVLGRIKSDSDPEKEYEIRLGADGNIYCSCPAWKYQKKPVKDRMCKHLEKFAKAHDMKLGEGDEIHFDGELMVLEMAPEEAFSMLQEGGEKFKKLVKQLSKRGDIEDPKALAAWIGREKYGPEKFAKMAAAGKSKK